MEATFRASMNWLHTWAGVMLGSVLFAIFWMGSLSVFDKEIDCWMAPVTRMPAAETRVSIDALRPSIGTALAAGSSSWFVALPGERRPATQVGYNDGDDYLTRYHDPVTGAALPDPGTLAGSRFLYPFHYMLHIQAANIGIWIVGVAGMAMLTLCVSGVIIHRKIFTDFFTLRLRKKQRRALLDMHNVAGAIGLPFHIVITFSGLIVFAATYFPSGWQAVYNDADAYYRDFAAGFDRTPSGKPGGEIASLDAMAAQARELWGGDTPSYLQIRNLGDTAAYVVIGRPNQDRVTASADRLWFDAASGRLLHRSNAAKPVMATQRFITGMHFIQFRHWTLRWLYFSMGLSGCVLIATGYLFWLDSRRKKHAQLGLADVRIVETLTIGSATGIILATFAFFVVNRMLPLGITFAGAERAALEVWAFYGVWLATFACAWMRPRRAWAEQCRVIAVLASTAVLLNWITTGDHLIHSLGHRHLWPIAGMDLLLLASAGIGALAAHWLDRRAGESSAPPDRAVKPVAQVAE